MEEAAYTWFNRFIAIKYMEAHGRDLADDGFVPQREGVESPREEGNLFPLLKDDGVVIEQVI